MNLPNPESQIARKPPSPPAFLEKTTASSDQITPSNQSLPNSSRATIQPLLMFAIERGDHAA
jgi:hypothetical protein